MAINLTPAECEATLAANHYGHLACTDKDEPYVVPITYVFAEGNLYGFTQKGKKTEIIRNNPKVCVQVEHVKSGSEWESVICWGHFEEIEDEKERQVIKLLLADQHGKEIEQTNKGIVSPLVKNINHSVSDNAETIVYRIKSYRMTGRAERP